MTLPPLIGLSHGCAIVPDIPEAVADDQRFLGTEPDPCIPHYRNKGFFQASDFLDYSEDNAISIIFLNVPGPNLTMEIREHHQPQGRKPPMTRATNDVSEACHGALKVTNIFDPVRKNDKAGTQAAADIPSRVKYLYFIDNYGLQGEFEQGHTAIGN